MQGAEQNSEQDEVQVVELPRPKADLSWLGTVVKRALPDPPAPKGQGKPGGPRSQAQRRDSHEQQRERIGSSQEAAHRSRARTRGGRSLTARATRRQRRLDARAGRRRLYRRIKSQFKSVREAEGKGNLSRSFNKGAPTPIPRNEHESEE
eukprot:3518170-Alexandrium_andersonii.AAC.1